MIRKHFWNVVDAPESNSIGPDESRYSCDRCFGHGFEVVDPRNFTVVPEPWEWTSPSEWSTSHKVQCFLESGSTPIRSLAFLRYVTRTSEVDDLVVFCSVPEGQVLVYQYGADSRYSSTSTVTTPVDLPRTLLEECG